MPVLSGPQAYGAAEWSGEEGCLVFPQLIKALFWYAKIIFKNPVHHKDQLTEFVSVMVGVSLVFRNAPALFVRYAQFYPQGVLLRYFADLIPLCV